MSQTNNSPAQVQWETHLPPLDVEDDPTSEELRQSLDTLADVIEALGIQDASFASYSSSIDQLTAEKFSLLRSLCRLKQVEDTMQSRLESLNHEIDLLDHWNKVLVPGSADSLYPEASTTLERRKDALVKKAKENHRQLEKLQTEEPIDVKVSIGQLLAQKERIQAKAKEIKEKRAKIKAFKGLPPNLELARHELRLARQKQMELIQLRERLLGKMADGVA
ncbi:hypothetical protein CPC08DRAFT_766654 [Agrocybe pediades]|nr:hypothetical protein CPC08DRAFT_766654 [Agrocybe pediades]